MDLGFFSRSSGQFNSAGRTLAPSALAKVKKAKALEKCQAFASLDTESISEIVDNMVYREMDYNV